MKVIDYAALATEINSDPAGKGYASPKAVGSDAGIAALLNQAGSGANFQVNTPPITAAQMLRAIDPAEFKALPADEKVQLQILCSSGSIDLQDANTIAILRNIFPAALSGGVPAAPTTRAAVIALVKRNGSRAEFRFGAGTLISPSDVAIALGRPA